MKEIQIFLAFFLASYFGICIRANEEQLLDPVKSWISLAEDPQCLGLILQPFEFTSGIPNI